MGKPTFETRLRRTALIATAVAASMTLGIGAGYWAVGDTNGFYMAPIDRYGRPGDARGSPTADKFWDRQRGSAPAVPQAGALSTATSAQPEYRSASGS